MLYLSLSFFMYLLKLTFIQVFIFVGQDFIYKIIYFRFNITNYYLHFIIDSKSCYNQMIYQNLTISINNF